MSTDQFLLCDKCGYREVRKAGGLYPAVVPAHCDQLLISEPLRIDSESLTLSFTTPSGKDVKLERVGFNYGLIICYRVTVEIIDDSEEDKDKRTIFWFSEKERDAAFNMMHNLKHEDRPPAYLEKAD